MKKILLFVFVLIFSTQPAFAAKDAEQGYLEAKSCYGELKVNPSKMKSRSEWEDCISKFEKVHDKYPKSERAVQALYNVGKLRAEMYGKLKKIGDAEASVKAYNQLIREYPTNSLADDSLFQIGKLRRNPLKQNDKARVAFEYLIENYPDGDMFDAAKAELNSLDGGEAAPSVTEKSDKSSQNETESDTESAPVEVSVPTPPATKPQAEAGRPAANKDAAAVFAAPPAGPGNQATLMSIDVNKKEDETLIYLNLSRRAAYSLDFLNSGQHTKTPPRLDMLLTYTKMGPSLEKDLECASQYLSKVKVKRGIFSGGTKISFEMAPESMYTIATKGDSIVLKFAKASKEWNGKAQEAVAAKKEGRSKQKPLTIIVDPGHGGADTGAIGPAGTNEKDVTLQLSKKLAAELKEKLGAKVFMTREKDVELTLEQRNAVAVKKKADMFVSVHVNASTNRKMSGIETYFLNNATDEAAAKLAKRENKSAGKKLSDVEHILSTMLQNYDAAQSQVLAKDVQTSLVSKVSKNYEGIKNRKVRSAMFYVLVGAKCPAILVEASFISNPQEEKRLGTQKYREEIATGIADGVKKYIQISDKRINTM